MHCLLTYKECVFSTTYKLSHQCLINSCLHEVTGSHLSLFLKSECKTDQCCNHLTLSSQFCISLTVIFLLQLVAGILGFVFSDTVQKQYAVFSLARFKTVRKLVVQDVSQMFNV